MRSLSLSRKRSLSSSATRTRRSSSARRSRGPRLSTSTSTTPLPPPAGAAAKAKRDDGAADAVVGGRRPPQRLLVPRGTRKHVIPAPPQGPAVPAPHARHLLDFPRRVLPRAAPAHQPTTEPVPKPLRFSPPPLAPSTGAILGARLLVHPDATPVCFSGRM
jgi:hypothetical protein